MARLCTARSENEKGALAGGTPADKRGLDGCHTGIGEFCGRGRLRFQGGVALRHPLRDARESMAFARQRLGSDDLLHGLPYQVCS
ncbi:hypothetical protein HRbin30_00246 [bacterium HR30]|nr:hypothetical protein HRbin30_00246 [bacterium HR30]